jgi:polyisoprenoid-binding protein YceI
VLALGITLLAIGPVNAATTFKIDPVHSSALFKIKHFGTSNFYGRFNDMSGTITYDAAAPSTASIQIEVAAGSVDTRVERRDQHIKSADFFNAAQFPRITFKSTKVEASGGDDLAVTGDLTFLGVTKSVTATVTKTGTGKHPQGGHELVGFETRLTIKRSDFGNSFMNGPLSDEVELIFALEAGAN